MRSSWAIGQLKPSLVLFSGTPLHSGHIFHNTRIQTGCYDWSVQHGDSPFCQTLWDRSCQLAIGGGYTLESANHYDLVQINLYFHGRNFFYHLTGSRAFDPLVRCSFVEHDFPQLIILIGDRKTREYSPLQGWPIWSSQNRGAKPPRHICTISSLSITTLI